MRGVQPRLKGKGQRHCLTPPPPLSRPRTRHLSRAGLTRSARRDRLRASAWERGESRCSLERRSPRRGAGSNPVAGNQLNSNCDTTPRRHDTAIEQRRVQAGHCSVQLGSLQISLSGSGWRASCLARSNAAHASPSHLWALSMGSIGARLAGVVPSLLAGGRLGSNRGGCARRPYQNPSAWRRRASAASAATHSS